MLAYKKDQSTFFFFFLHILLKGRLLIDRSYWLCSSGIHPCPCCLIPALCFHISLAGRAACTISFNYPPCQRTGRACLLALVITGFRGQVIRSWLHCHPVRLLRPRGANGMKELYHLQSVKARY